MKTNNAGVEEETQLLGIHYSVAVLHPPRTAETTPKHAASFSLLFTVHIREELSSPLGNHITDFYDQCTAQQIRN